MTQATKKVTEIVSVRNFNIVLVSLLPTEYDGHELDKYWDGDVGRADVGKKQEDRLGEQLVAVLHGGEDNHIEDGNDDGDDDDDGEEEGDDDDDDDNVATLMVARTITLRTVARKPKDISTRTYNPPAVTCVVEEGILNSICRDFCKKRLIILGYCNEW